MKLWIARLKYYLLRKYLIEEMSREGWRADPLSPGRLVINSQREVVPGGGALETFTWSAAEHEAVAHHFRQYPLIPK